MKEEARTLFAAAAGRLGAARFLVGGSSLVLVLVVLAAGGAPWLLAAGIAALLAIAALVPYRTESRSVEGTAEGRPPEAIDRVGAAALAAVVPDPLVVFDREGAVVLANEAAVAAFGPFGANAPVRFKFRAPEMQALIDRALATGDGGEAVDYSERVPVERLYRVVARPLGGEGALLALAFRDQSEARRIDRMRADFIANASHELRTPLASVSGFIETLRGPAKDDAKAREQFLQIMESQTRRMARLIDDLLSLSRLEMKPHRRPGDRVDVAEVAAAVADALAPLAADLGVAIEKRLPARPAPIAGDRDEIFQVFENLLENACKYGQPGKRVVLTVESGAEGVVATVEDFGPGIPKEHIPRITERFYRIDDDASRERKGTGLGLAIVKHILTRHAARLTIRSDIGKGAAFTIHFPPP